MHFSLGNRLSKLPPYLFAQLDEMKKQELQAGKDIINLSIGDPDLPTPAPVIEELHRASRDPENHKYPSYTGLLSFRETVAEWYKRSFNVQLDPATEVLALIGGKEGIAHTPFAFINPGDIVLCPNPAYPVYANGTILAGGTPYFMPLRESNNFFPDLHAIPKRIRKKAKIMWLNYPNNPTTALATESFFKEAISFAEKWNILICHDAPYSEIYFNSRPISFLAIPGARTVGIEFHSLSKTLNMTGWRIAMVAGNQSAIHGIGTVKKNIDSGAFNAIQYAGITGLTQCDELIAKNRAIWKKRRDILGNGLQEAGWNITFPEATFYFWIKNKPGITSMNMVTKILKEAGVLATPGSGFGKDGEGFIRMTFTATDERLTEAVERIKRIQW